MLAPRVIVVSPYDYRELCGMACALVEFLEGLPLRVSFSGTAPLVDPLPEVHYKHDRKIWSQPLDPVKPRNWHDAQYVIWFDRHAYQVHRDLGLGKSAVPINRRHWLVESHSSPVNWPPDDKLTGVRVSWNQPPSRPGNLDFLRELDRNREITWDNNLPLHSRSTEDRRGTRLLILAGTQEEDATWALAYSRAGRQVANWLTIYPELASVKVVCATPARRRRLGDITPAWWAELQQAFPDRVELDVRPLPYMRRMRLLGAHDLFWNLSPHSSQLWTLDAATSGMGILLERSPTTETLLQPLQPCCESLPEHREWLRGSNLEDHWLDQEAVAAMGKLLQDWRRRPRPWSRPALETNRRLFQEFWRGQLEIWGPDT